MAIEREVAGMRCGEVLGVLSEYLDGDLATERRTQLEAHLQGCDVCRRFGGAFTTSIAALRREEDPGPAESSAVYERLSQRLEGGKP
jgi:anti-sigma factor RsiW